MESGLKVRSLRAKDRDAVLGYLERDPRLNLALIDQVLRLGKPGRHGDPRPRLLAAWRGEEPAGVAAQRPSLMLDARVGPEVLEALFPRFGSVSSGLLKSTEERVAPLWDWLRQHGHRALLDRFEIGYAVTAYQLRPAAPPPGWRLRSAVHSDLDALVEAARQSLLEEHRPDPSLGDPSGFRVWVENRLSRAVVAEGPGRQLGFVGYADVRCERGWLLQGVFTWPKVRRIGLATAGVTELCRRAFGARSEHVQLAVVEGNRAAERMYEGLGFVAYARLRTLLFA